MAEISRIASAKVAQRIVRRGGHAVDYKLYVLDAEGHIAVPPTVIECATDQEALQEAKRYIDGKPIEVWRGKKMLARLDPEINSKV